MKLLGLRIGGIGVHRGDLVVPLADLGDAQIISVAGENGAGKTTILECVPGVLYRTTPSRGPIAGLAQRRDSYIEATIDLAGERFTARVLIDGVARQPKTEAYLTDGAGEPITTGKVTDYAAAIEARFAAREVYLASAYAAQSGEGRFLEIPPASRKELFARLLGLGHLQELADAAGERFRAAELELERARARTEALRREADTAEQRAAAVEVSGEAVVRARAAREAAEREVEAARAAMEAWSAATARLDQEVLRAEGALREAHGNRANAEGAVARASAQLARVSLDRANITEQLSRRGHLEAEAAAGEKASARAVEVEAEIEVLRRRKDEHAAALNRWQTEHARLERELTVRRTACDTAVRDAETRVDQARRDLAAAERSAAGLERVPCAGVGKYASCPLIATATGAYADLDRLHSAVAAAEAALPSTERAHRAPIEDAERRLLDLGPAPAALDVSGLPGLEGERRHLAEQQAAGTRARAQLEALADAERRAGALDAEAATLREQLAGARLELARVSAAVVAATTALDHARHSRVSHAGTRPVPVDATALAKLRAAETAAAAELARAEAALDAAQRAAAELAEVQAGITTAAADLDDWAHLQAALGKSGIQALEIDAAGPEVSALCNELLHACYGTRFTVSLETTALKADGRGTKEVFDLSVIDTERGVEGSADQLSGGERVIVSEALALAICIYNARRSSVPMLDLFRDECAGALSTANAVRYVEMLRRALDLGGFHRVYFVAHQPHLWDLADAVLLVEPGSCRVVAPEEIQFASDSRHPSEAADDGHPGAEASA